MQKTFLYRARDHEGALLYVGITSQPNIRLSTHACSAPWRHLSQDELEWVEYSSRKEAEAAEREEISSHRPPFNKAGNPDKMRCGLQEPVRVGLLVSKEMRRNWRLAALARNTTVSALIEEAMTAHLTKRIDHDRAANHHADAPTLGV